MLGHRERPIERHAVTTPYQIDFRADAPMLPGIYEGHFVITWATGSIAVPVTFSVSASPLFPPIIASIVSAASARPGSIAPGEIISILGTERHRIRRVEGSGSFRRQSVKPGVAVPITITIGSSKSPEGVTVSIQ